MDSSTRPTSSAAFFDAVDAAPAGTSYPSVIAAHLGTEGALGRGWRMEAETDHDGVWIRVQPGEADTPAQGWKLHVSAAPISAAAVLSAALPVLLSEDAPFKVAASDEVLDFLNNGEAGLSQVGKFITVYPLGEDQAVRLGAALHDATNGLRGPAVPYDRPFTRGSLVHYRYGTFVERLAQSAVGEVGPVIRGPQGELLPDRPSAPAPAWVRDPFEPAGLSAPAPSQLVGDCYRITGMVHRSAGGAIRLALDTHARRGVVLKQAFRDARLGTDGLDARDHLRREAAVLQRLAPDPHFPAVLDIVEHEGDLFVAMEQLEGPTISEYTSAYLRSGHFVSNEQIAARGRRLSGALQAIHDAGYIYRDMKSSNVIIGPDGEVRMIDFEFAYEQSSDGPVHGLGTRGYCSSDQVAGAPPSVADDVYGLGAILYLMATGAEPAEAPDPADLLTRPLEVLNPGLSPELRTVIEKCLIADPKARFPSMSAVENALAAAGEAQHSAPPLGAEVRAETSNEAQAGARALALRLADTLCKARRAPGPDAGPAGSGVARALDLNSGTAGVVLALAELVGEFGDPIQRGVLEAAVASLASAPQLEGDPLPGLYVGEAGVAAALLRTGQILHDDRLVDAACDRGRRLADIPHANPDLFNGSAGRLRLHLLLFDATGEAEHLKAAVAAGDFLLDAAESASGELSWTIPSGYDTLSGLVCTGYAHGAAGIADALLDLFDATEDEHYLAGATGAGRWLARLARPSLDDGSGATWPEVEGGPRTGPTWCRGSAGIGRFWLHASALDALPEAADLALRSARMIARAGRAVDPSQCHGLSGNIEFLIDAALETGESAFLDEAYSLARLLDAFAVERDGMLMWCSDEPQKITPAYMTGFSGVAMCLLRLSDPQARPHQLSRRGFRLTRA